MSFLAKIISKFTTDNVTKQITTKLVEIVRAASTRSLCKRESRPDLRNMVIKFGKIRCRTPPPTCGITRKPREHCRPKLEVSEERKKCCGGVCLWANTRFDDIYYKPSDKENRKYQQTWNDCGELYIYPRALCCYDKPKYLLPERRKPKKPIPSCDDLKYCQLQMLCRNRLESKCARLSWAPCRAVRVPPKCGGDRKHCGKRIKTPYPSYSECCKNVRPLKSTAQCECLKIPVDCY